MAEDFQPAGARVIDIEDLGRLIELLRAESYCVVGPTISQDAIVYDEIRRIEDLPAGWTDSHAPGTYRLARREDRALFGYVVGPHSWKKYLHPPRRRLWRAERTERGVSVTDEPEPPVKFAFLGVRSCEIHAMEILDRVFAGTGYQDDSYRARRENALVIAVNCGQAGGTCFCVSMETGPEIRSGFDLGLTELLDGDGHRFLIEAGSPTGVQWLGKIPSREAKDADMKAAGAATARARDQMGRSMDTSDIKELLQTNLEHPRWDEVAERCLTCANCTMVCPTCFCSTVEDTTDLTGEHAERWQRWDSCFTIDFTYIHGGSVRRSSKSRYRQWMTHKLAHWYDQFGTSGCVGCGRCITWCPVGIDITEEVAAIRSSVPPQEEPT